MRHDVCISGVVAGSAENEDAFFFAAVKFFLIDQYVTIIIGSHAYIDDIRSVFTRISDPFDDVGSIRESPVIRYFTCHELNVPGDTGGAQTVVSAGSDDTGNECAVLVVIHGIRIEGSIVNVDAMDITDSGRGIYPHIIFQVFMFVVDAGIYDGHDDRRSFADGFPRVIRFRDIELITRLRLIKRRVIGQTGFDRFGMEDQIRLSMEHFAAFDILFGFVFYIIQRAELDQLPVVIGGLQ